MRRNEGFTLLELLIVVVILGVLALIAAPTLLNAADKAKEGAVKANVSAASSTVTTRLAVEEENAGTASSTSVNMLNNAGTADNVNDDAKSPFDSTVNAFVEGSGGAKGQVAIGAAGGDDAGYAVTISGLGKDGTTVIASKTVRAPQEASSAAPANTP